MGLDGPNHGHTEYFGKHVQVVGFLLSGVSYAEHGVLSAAHDLDCEPAGIERTLNAGLHPTGWVLGGNEYLGCLAASALIVIGAYILSFAFLKLVEHWDADGNGLLSQEEIQETCFGSLPCMKNNESVDVGAVARHPNTVLLVALFVYPGVLVSAARLSLDSSARDSDWQAILGALVCASCAALPYLLYRTVSRGVAPPTIRAHVRPWDIKPGMCGQYVLYGETGDWVSLRSEDSWVSRYQAVVRRFNSDHAPLGVMVEVSVMWLMSAFLSLEFKSWFMCGFGRLLSGVVMLLKTLFIVMRKPYRKVRDNLMLGTCSALVCTELFVNAVTFFMEKEPGVVGDICLFIASIIIVLRSVLDVVAEVLLFVKGYRATAQRVEYGEVPERAINPPLDYLRTQPVDLPEYSDSVRTQTPSDDPLAAASLPDAWERRELETASPERARESVRQMNKMTGSSRPRSVQPKIKVSVSVQRPVAGPFPEMPSPPDTGLGSSEYGAYEPVVLETSPLQRA
eukprot:Hpha_TRINITY_DN9007_c0_g2::TRINITY_DN9007_c0_g2_i1::g.141779::m.141779